MKNVKGKLYGPPPNFCAWGEWDFDEDQQPLIRGVLSEARVKSEMAVER